MASRCGWGRAAVAYGAAASRPVAAAGAPPGRAHTRAEPLYKQRGALIERRVSDLISKMTLEEKVYQMLGDGMGGMKLCQHFNATSVGSMGWQVSSPADL